MNTQDLEKLCDYLECNDASLEAQQEAATELRRLHTLNQELLEALKDVVDWLNAPSESAFSDSQFAKVCAAIAKAEGEKQ